MTSFDNVCAVNDAHAAYRYIEAPHLHLGNGVTGAQVINPSLHTETEQTKPTPSAVYTRVRKTTISELFTRYSASYTTPRLHIAGVASFCLACLVAVALCVNTCSCEALRLRVTQAYIPCVTLRDLRRAVLLLSASKIDHSE